MTNLQGDVLHLLDSNKQVVASYTYDPYGKVLSATGTLAEINPLRYRGYVYDQETSRYYLQSRYYDPPIGRWINADGLISGVGGELLGYNQFAYCFNNPVNMNDSTGNWPRWITAAVAVVATIVSATTTSTSAYALAITSYSAYISQCAHYDVREARNDAATLPQSPGVATNAGWINSNPKSALNPNGGGPAADCHQFTATNKPNVKYVSPDGRREVIYDSTGAIVLDPRDIGTYNFCPSDENWYSNASIGHVVHDVIPWVIFGNSDSDPGPLVNAIISLFK